MSTMVDSRVAEMRFDNRNFEKNVQTSMSTLEKLKQSLNLSGATKGIDEINNAARGFNLSGMTNAAETVVAKFSYMQMSIQHQLNNIVDSAMRTGKRVVSALTIDPIKTGFSEYETQINAVQTILANTSSKGTTLDQVNTALDTLNEYADKTIYNFTEMTRNIGTFTAAGVDLDKSVSAIQGIANLAAVSGSTSQQASTAMYQLSQALAAGRVNLQDWNSVVNAGMGGQVFQDALKNTSRAMKENAKNLKKMSKSERDAYAKSHGYTAEQMKSLMSYNADVDKAIKKYGSFRESLSKGQWMTAEVLTKTLEQFTLSAEEGSTEWNNFKKSLMEEGYTEKQATEILKMANTATDAATKVKTFTQLWDTLKESAQSGWTQSWEILVGDFEEAKAALTTVSDVIGEMINNSSKARNDLLKGWKDAGGRTDLLDGIKNAFNGVMAVVTPIKEAMTEIFPPMTVDQLVKVTKGFKDLTQTFKDFATANGEKIHNTFRGIFSVFDIGWMALKEVGKGVGTLISQFTGLGGGILSITSSIGLWLTSLRDSIAEGDVFGKTIGKITEVIKPIGEGVRAFVDSIVEGFDIISQTAEIRFEPLAAIGQFIKSIFTGLGNLIGKMAPMVSKLATGLTEALTTLTDGLGEAIQGADYNKIFDFINGGIFSAIGLFIAKFAKGAGDIFDGANGFLENFQELMEGVGDALGAFTQSLHAKTIKEIAIAVGILAGALFVLALIKPEQLVASLSVVSTVLIELMVALDMLSTMGGGKGIKGIGGMAAAMISLSSALLILAVAMKVLSTIPIEQMCAALGVMSISMAEIVWAIGALPEKKVKQSAKSLKTLASSLVIFAVAMKIMGSMEPKELGAGLVGMTTGLTAMVIALNKLPKDVSVKASGMISIASAMVILAGALKIMGTMSVDEMGIALSGMAVGIIAMVTALNTIPDKVSRKAGAMVTLSVALIGMATALKIIGSMSIEQMAASMLVMSISLGTLVAALNAIPKDATLKATSLIVISSAMVILAGALKIMGSMSWDEIIRGLAGLGGSLAVIGIAAALLQPLVPTMLGMAGAIALLGVGCLAAGAGVLAIGAGLTALAAAVAASGGAITVFISSLISLIPFVMTQIGIGIISLVKTIAGSADAICEGLTVIITALVEAIVKSVPTIVDGFMVLITSVLDSLVTHIPEISNSVFDLLIGVIDTLSERMPELIQSVVNLISSLFTGVADALQSLDTAKLLQGTIAVGLLTGLMFALSSVAGLTPGAMLGVLGVGAVVAELALVLAAIGGLAQIPGLSWLVEEGGNFLEKIGTAIGQFVGGLAGGIAQGFTSSLPAIGTDLANFMTNVKPFIDGAKLIDASVCDGVMSLVGAILAITGADVVNSIASFITGGTSMADFGAQLVPFGQSLKQYSDAVAGINPTAIMASAIAAKAIIGIANEIPNEGGIVSWFTGDNSIASFADELPTLGKGLKGFSDSVSGINAENTIAASTAAVALAKMTNTVPADSVVLQSFGSNLETFGGKLKSYYESASEITADSIANSTKAIDAIRTGAASINTTDLNAVSSAITTLIKSLKSMAGVGEYTVAGFTSALSNLASTSVTAILNEFTNAGPKLAKAGRDLIQQFMEGVESRHSKVENSGKMLLIKFKDGINDKVQTVIDACNKLLENCRTTLLSYKDEFYFVGVNVVTGFANGISYNKYLAVAKAREMANAAANAAKKALDEHSPSRVFYEIGDYAGLGFVNALSDSVKSAYRAGSDMANSATDGINSAISSVTDMFSGDIGSQPVITPVLDLSNIESGAATIGSIFGSPSVGVMSNLSSISTLMNRNNQNGTTADVIQAIDKLRGSLGDVGGNNYNINGLNYNNDGAVQSAIEQLVRAITMEGRV